MKQPIKDVIQLVIALLITGSMASAMQPISTQQPMKLTDKEIHNGVVSQSTQALSKTKNSPATLNSSVKQAVPVTKTVNDTASVQTAATALQNAPNPPVTWQDNPNHCDQTTQWIASAAPFNCIDKPVAQPVATSVAAPASNTVSGCGDNNYANAIYMWETGCKLVDPNSEGCDGIGQACPASKIYAACPNMDYACQNAWFTNYAISRYGSWASAYAFHLAYGWW